MKIDRIFWILPRSFEIFCNLENGTQLHEEEQTGSNQQEPMFSTDVLPDTVEMPENNTSTVTTRILLRGVRFILEIDRPDVVKSGAVDVGRHSNGKDAGVSVSEHCAEI